MGDGGGSVMADMLPGVSENDIWLKPGQGERRYTFSEEEAREFDQVD